MIGQFKFRLAGTKNEGMDVIGKNMSRASSPDDKNRNFGLSVDDTVGNAAEQCGS